ncbi:MAG: stabilization protein [Chthoniobacteraceae bacterium]
MSKPKSTPKPKAPAAELVQIVISNVPAELVEAIETIAAGNDRPRAAEIRQLLAEAVQQRRLTQAAA